MDVKDDKHVMNHIIIQYIPFCGIPVYGANFSINGLNEKNIDFK